MREILFQFDSQEKLQEFMDWWRFKGQNDFRGSRHGVNSDHVKIYNYDNPGDIGIVDVQKVVRIYHRVESNEDFTVYGSTQNGFYKLKGDEVHPITTQQ